MNGTLLRAMLLMPWLILGCEPVESEPTEPLDLIPHARLTASATRAYELLPWPREAEQAIATVRDDQTSTFWQAPPDRTSTVEIDLQPWLEQAVALSSLALHYSGAEPASVEVRLAGGCGVANTATLAWPDPHAILALGGREAGCVTIAIDAGADGFDLQGLELLGRDPRIALPQPDTYGTGAPAHTTSGVVEGMYGVPWSWREREQMLIALAASGLGTYLYAPKDDPLHRASWREPYPEPDVARFTALAEQADALGVRLLFGVSPLIDLDFGAGHEADHAILRDKLRHLLDAGCHGVALLADDIEFELDRPVDAALGADHRDLANRLLAELRQTHPELIFWFVPTVYSDARLDDLGDGPGYLAALADLDPAIEVMWTGPDTSSATMLASDLQRVTGIIGRSPLIWDNFWANDGGDGFNGRLLLGPFSGRGPDLPGAFNGLVINPMIQGSLSRLAMRMAAVYLDHPRNPDAQRARSAAATGEARLSLRHDTHDASILERVIEVFEGYAQTLPRYQALEQSIDALLAALDADAGPPLEPMLATLDLAAGMVALPSEVHHSGLAAGLVDELQFPMDKVRHEGEAVLWSLALLGARLGDQPGHEPRAYADAALERSALDRFRLGTGRIRALFDRADAQERATTGYQPLAAGVEPPGCVTGQPLQWSPFSGATQLRVHGLPGASVEADRVQWTPPHSGQYHGVVVGASAQGHGFSMFTLTCETG